LVLQGKYLNGNKLEQIFSAIKCTGEILDLTDFMCSVDFNMGTTVAQHTQDNI